MDGSLPSLADRRLVWGTYTVAAALLVTGWAPIIFIRISIDSFSNYDLGIYSQAIYRLSWNELNPWLSVRAINLFNDHFEPILLIAAPLAKLIEPAYAGAIVELVAVVLSPTAVVWLWKRGQIDAGAGAIAIVYLLHCRGILAALLFPFHPTTWAILPAAWLAATILADVRRGVLLSLLALFCCKQEFPLMGMMVALLYATRREFRFAILIGSLSAAWFAAAVWLRPIVLGPVHDYLSGRLLSPEGLWATIERGWYGIQWRGIVHVLLPLLPLAAWAVWNRESTLWQLWLLLVPPVALRYLGQAWMLHYMPPLLPVLVFGLLPLGAQARLPRSIVLGTFAMLVAMNVGFWLRSAETLSYDRLPTDVAWNAERVAAIEQARQFLLAHPEGTALIQGNLLPRLVRRPEVYMVAGGHDRGSTTFRYVLVEKPPSGYTWPASPADYRSLIDRWRAVPDARVILDDEHVFLAEGEFRDLPPN
jgi:uncharacterized membrane protein